jgi:hypothetical protein
MARMSIPTRVCKICNQEKGRVAMGRYPKGNRIRYVDEKKQYWNSRICPDCNNNRVSESITKLRSSRKTDETI